MPSHSEIERPVAGFVPKWVNPGDQRTYLIAGYGWLDGLCLHEQPKTTGKWVCLLRANHEGGHG